jgi:hypothetical protein
MNDPRTTLIHFDEDVYLEAKNRSTIMRKTLSDIINDSVRADFGVPIRIKYDRKKARDMSTRMSCKRAPTKKRD